VTAEDREDAAVDPLTGEPKRGWLGGYQKVEDGFGQGTIAAVVFLVVFFAYLLLADPI
jgi:hypothetical protein